MVIRRTHEKSIRFFSNRGCMKRQPKIDTGQIFSDSITKVMVDYKDGKPIDKDKVREELINSGLARLLLMQMNRKQEVLPPSSVSISLPLLG